MTPGLDESYTVLNLDLLALTGGGTSALDVGPLSGGRASGKMKFQVGGSSSVVRAGDS
jgi:hypothetical protein